MNHTSQIPIEGTARSALRITELTDNGAWIEMPARSCAVGHTISLRILARTILNRDETVTVEETLTDENSLHFTAMVDEIQDGEGTSSQQVLISFRQHTPQEWESLIRYFNDKQEKLNFLLRRTRQ